MGNVFFVNIEYNDKLIEPKTPNIVPIKENDSVKEKRKEIKS